MSTNYLHVPGRELRRVHVPRCGRELDWGLDDGLLTTGLLRSAICGAGRPVILGTPLVSMTDRI